jgi:hypothetical protein
VIGVNTRASSRFEFPSEAGFVFCLHFVYNSLNCV